MKKKFNRVGFEPSPVLNLSIVKRYRYKYLPRLNRLSYDGFVSYFRILKTFVRH